jgi:hypothetical protein
MELNSQQKQELWNKGYVSVSGVVPPVMITEALRAINHSVGQGMNVADMTKFRVQSYCPEIQSAPPIKNLLTKTPAWDLAESVIGVGKIKPPGGGQIALRFPSLGEPAPARPHLDGMYSPTNGVPEGTIGNFTMLLGIFLSDVPQAGMGNLHVWPGTHRLYEQYFRDHGPQSLLQGLPPVAMPEPEAMIGRAGDAVLVHYQTAHGVGPNVSPSVRYTIFFRLHHVDHDTLHWECMTDIWREWEGMQGIGGS